MFTRKAGMTMSARCRPFQTACGCHRGTWSSALLTYSMSATVMPRAMSTLCGRRCFRFKEVSAIDWLEILMVICQRPRRNQRLF